MTELSRDALLEIVRTVWQRHDPVPDHLVAAMQAAAALADSDLDLELMELVELSTERVGARGSTSDTLRFVHGDTDLLLRVAVDGERSRVGGWGGPAEPMAGRALPGVLHPYGSSEALVTGRFDLLDLPLVLLRLRLEPHDTTRPAF